MNNLVARCLATVAIVVAGASTPVLAQGVPSAPTPPAPERKRTCELQLGTSALCQKRTFMSCTAGRIIGLFPPPPHAA